MANTFRNDKTRGFLRISVIPRRVAFGSIWRYFIGFYFLDFGTVRILFERRTSKRGREGEGGNETEEFVFALLKTIKRARFYGIR